MKRRYIVLFALTALLASCKDNELFEKEMYKNEVALISSDDHNTFEEVVSLTGEEVTGYIAASVGGTHAPDQDLLIELQEDAEPLDAYNWALFDADESLYAKLLPKDRYEIAEYKIRIPAGERTGRTMIKLRPDGLSPDSTYFIGLKGQGAAGVELNPEKNTILYQVIIKNDYTTVDQDTYYEMTGTRDGLATAANKKMFPISRNSVRVVAGTEAFESNVEDINRTAIIIEVNEDNTLSIKPYKDIVVNQLDHDPRYSNTFHVESIYGRTYNVFLLSYSYTIDGVTKVMKEELRMEITK